MMKRIIIVAALLLAFAAGASAQVERAYLATQVVFNRVIAKTAACTTGTYSVGFFRYHGLGYVRAHKDDSCSFYLRVQVSSRPDSSGSFNWVEWDTLWSSATRADTLQQGRSVLGTFSIPPVPYIRFIGEGRSDNGTGAFLKVDYVGGS
jgi:hypothetical protein